MGEYSTLITKGTTPRDKSGIGVVNFVKVENLVNGDIIPLQKIQLEEHEGYLKRSQLIENDILFSIAGTLGRTAIVKKSILPANTNQALSIIRGYEFDRNFLVTILRGVVVREFIKRNPTIGAQPNLSLEQVSNLCLLTPCSEEQSAIGTFFSTLDRHITLHQRKLDKLKSVKQAYLSEMFPAEGERVPKRRFPGFTDDWELRKLGEVAEIVMGQSPDSKNYTDNPLDNILVQGNADLRDGCVVPRVWTTQVTKTAEKGDLILSVRAPVGDVGRTNYNVVLGRGVAGIKGNEFIYHLLVKMKLFGYWTKLSTGSTFESINSDDIKNSTILFPSHPEQEAIGTFFSTLDRQITLHQRKS